MKKIIIGCVLFVLIISAIIVLRTKMIKFSVNYNEIPLNKEVYISDIINLKNGSLVNDDKIDSSKLGNSLYKVEVKDFLGRKHSYEVKVLVVDDEAPIIEAKDSLSTYKGTEIDLLKDVSATDNSNEEVILEVVGDYDFNKVGEYKLQYKATDTSKNETTKDFILIIKEKIISSYVYSNNEPTDFFTTSKGFSGYKINGVTYINGTLVVNKTYSLPINYNPGGLTREVKEAMNKMFSDAKNEGLNIYLSSGFRSYETQKALYARYSNRDGAEKADTYSARAGHSEHQSGLAFDVNQINSTFDNTDEAIWLENNSYKYGFILRYPKGKMSITGYKYESWHYRYVGADLATKLYNNGDYITLEEYFGITSEYNS